MRTRWMIGLLMGWLVGSHACVCAGQMQLKTAQELMQKETKDANQIFSLSFFFEAAGRPFSALRAAERAIALNPKIPGFHARLGQLLMSRQRYKEAAAAYKRAADMDPKTKSFRAAQARALAQCSMLKEATQPWQMLLDSTTDRREVLDAARSLAQIQYQLHDPAAAETTWTAALDKLTSWEDKLAAADALTAAMKAQDHYEAALAFWKGFGEGEKDWARRATVADRVYQIAVQTPGSPVALQDGAVAIWDRLLASATQGKDKQRAGRALAEIHLRRNQPAEAVKALAPHVLASSWSDNFASAQLLARAHAAAGQAAERVAVWRQVLAAAKNFKQKYQAAIQLESTLEDNAGAIKLFLGLVKAFPKEYRAHASLAGALEANGAYAKAADAWLQALKVQRAQRNHQVYRESSGRTQVMRLLALAQQPERAFDIAVREWRNEQNGWQVRSWLSTIHGTAGEAAAMTGASRFIQAGGILALGAGQYLSGQNQPRAAKAAYARAAADPSLHQNHRREALRALINMERSMDTRIDLGRQLVSLGGSFWTRRQDYRRLAATLAEAGRISDGVDLVREAEQVRQRKATAGPDTLQTLASHIFQGNRVGRDLRTEEGIARAEKAVAAFFGSRGRDRQYNHGFQQLIVGLSRVRTRRGQVEQAQAFLQNLVKIQDRSYLHLELGSLYAKTPDKALQAYCAYAKALAREHAEDFQKQNPRYRQHRAVSFDSRVLAFLKEQDQDKAFVASVEQAMAAAQGPAHEGLADVLMGFLRARNQPEAMQKVLERLKAKKHNMRPYAQLTQWVTGAVRMKNASSQADARRREQLLRQVKRYKDALQRNPEDYQAAINVYKVLLQLGRKKEGDPYLAQALKIAAQDPVALERYGRELMLIKRYDDAAKVFAKAAEISGRQSDYEESMVSSSALAGDHKQALTLALDSLAQGRNHDRGVRSVEQMLDMAERSDNLKFLHEAVTKRLALMASRQETVSEHLARLALRLAWDHHDAGLAKRASLALLHLARTGTGRWREEWRLWQLAQKAEERRQLEDAIRIRQALLEARLARGYVPDVNSYRQLALLLVKADQSPAAATLMFDGLDRAMTRTIITRPQPHPMPIWLEERARRRPLAPAGGADSQALVPRQVRLPWISAILEMAALEGQSGGQAFQKACGERLQVLVDQELSLLQDDPVAYGGPLTNPLVEQGLKLRARLNAAYKAGVKADAPASQQLARARRLLALATRGKKEDRVGDIRFADIQTHCARAVARATDKEKPGILLQVAGIYRQLLSQPEAERLADVTPALVLDAYGKAVAAGGERHDREAQRQALAVAMEHKLYAQAMPYAEALYKKLPLDDHIRTAYVQALFGTGKVDEAAAVLQADLAQDADYTDYEGAAQVCLALKDSRAAAREASILLDKAIMLYRKETGDPITAEGQPMADSVLGNLYLELLRAHAAAGEVDAMVSAFLTSLFHRQVAPEQNELALVIKTCKDADKLPALITALQQATNHTPKDANLRLALATVSLENGDTQAAAHALLVAKVLEPDLATVKKLIAILRQAKDYRTALEECRAWADTFPHDADAWRTMASIYEEMKDDKRELQALTMLVEIAPREAANCREVAVLFAERRAYDRATALMERAIELRPEEPYRHIDLAEVLFMAEDYERAEEICRDALQRDWEKGLAPELLQRMPPYRGTFENRAHSLLADIYTATKRQDEAAKEKLHLPTGYKRPDLGKAMPQAGRRPWPRPLPLPGRFLQGRRL